MIYRLYKFKSIKKENFLLHLKECEFGYNTKTTQENLYQKLLKSIRENPLKLIKYNPIVMPMSRLLFDLNFKKSMKFCNRTKF